MTLSLITAMDENRVIGLNNKLPWNVPEDLKHFQRTTTGHTVIMGRKTYESLGIHKPLPNRVNIVLSRTHSIDIKHPEVRFETDLENAISVTSLSSHSPLAFIIGGAEIYKQALPLVDSMFITLISGEHAGDTHFPAFDVDDWNISTIETGDNYQILKYDRRIIS